MVTNLIEKWNIQTQKKRKITFERGFVFFCVFGLILKKNKKSSNSIINYWI
jgi:hypothetical protein